jgi:hypothetical protein
MGISLSVGAPACVVWLRFRVSSFSGLGSVLKMKNFLSDFFLFGTSSAVLFAGVSFGDSSFIDF